MNQHRRCTNRCDGIHRRDALRIGSLTGLGLGLTDWFRLPVLGTEDIRRESRHAKSCILLWLDGGPSHLETFDIKPQAPLEVRGPFQAISTNVPGIRISELLPATAQHADKFAIIRSMTSPLGEHGIANQYLLTGYEPSPSIRYPSFGSVVAELRSTAGTLPANIAIPDARSAGAGFLGTTKEPFLTRGDPSKPGFRVPDLEFFPEVNEQRLLRRKNYLKAFDQRQADFEKLGREYGAAFEQAYRLVTTVEAKQAFDLTQESDPIRARYGYRMFGQSCLLARRLVERGVPFVTVTNTGWDTHQDLVLHLKSGYAGAAEGVGLIPTFDQGFSALLDDLAQRGMLAETLVVAMGEFGRTPKINSSGGRDHWPRVFSVVLAGGGIQGGRVIGASDRVGESPADQPVTPNDLAFTIYTLLGIDPNQELTTPDGRPVPVNQGGRLIQNLI